MLVTQNVMVLFKCFKYSFIIFTYMLVMKSY